MPKLRPPKLRPPPVTSTSPRAAASGDFQVTGSDLAPGVRTLTLASPDGPVASLTYHLSDPVHAVVQILHIEVAPEHRRRGHATRLVTAAVADAQQLLRKAPNSPRLRRVYAATAHKTHIHFRAVLTGLGFHHVSTLTGLAKSEDLLIYIKSYT